MNGYPVPLYKQLYLSETHIHLCVTFLFIFKPNIIITSLVCCVWTPKVRLRSNISNFAGIAEQNGSLITLINLIDEVKNPV